MKTLQELAVDCGIPEHIAQYYRDELKMFIRGVAEIVAQDIADNIRETYLHEHAEGIAFNIETIYGIHRDYGDR